LAFSILPVLLAIHITMQCRIKQGFTTGNKLLFITCVLTPPILMGFKVGLLEILLGAWIVGAFCGPLIVRRSRLLLGLKRSVVVLVALVPTLVLYNATYGERAEWGVVFNDIIYRMLGVYSQQFAVLPAYVEQAGYVKGATIPILGGVIYGRTNISPDHGLCNF